MNDSGNDESSFDPDDQFFVECLKELEGATTPETRDSILKKYSRQRPDLESVLCEMAHHEHNCQQSYRQADSYAPPGQLGEFLIGRRIGIEGMGEVYEAYHERLERRVAVKIIRRGRTSDEAKNRFLREQRVLARLHQTHIVPIHTAGEQDGLQFFAMPLIEGASLKSVVQAARQFSTADSAQETPSIARIVSSKMTSDASISNATEALPKSASNSVSLRTRIRIRYSQEYHTSVAQAMAIVADAVGYAHAAGVLHRDIKPHNIMIQPNGHVWVIDFGLAGFLQPASDTGQGTPTDADSRTSATVLSYDEEPKVTRRTLGGTAHYMAPERWENCKADVPSDIWALGATLYELLTLRRAFEGRTDDDIRQEILKHDPKAAKELVDGLPSDLAAICHKAMHREPAHRYQTAADLAADLRCWLNHEPTTALPARAPRRAMLWCRRNPGWAWLIGAMVMMALLFSGMEVKLIAAQKKAIQVRNHKLAIRDIDRIQSSTHAIGWSERIWNDGARLEGEADVRDALATSLIDIDAEEIYNDLTTQADFLAFDELGELLVCGGSTDDSGTLLQPPKVLDLKTQTWHDSTINGSGPVAFRKDRAPVVLVPDPESARRVRLFAVKTSLEIASFITEGPAVKLTIDNRPILALSADATFAVVATPVKNSDGNIIEYDVSVWNTSTSERICQCVVVGASSVAITPDGSILAVGQETGQVGLWNIDNAVQFANLPHGRSSVRSLAFAKDYLRRLHADADDAAVLGAGWLLACGDSAGGLIVWDVTLRKPRNEMRGSHYETLSLAFSHDSSVLFSVGRNPGRIWDIATGDLILTWDLSSYMPAIAVTRNGLLASARDPAFGFVSGVQVQKLLNDRGGIVLRGLRDAVRRLKVSADGSLIAGLTMTWQIGVWKSDGTLLHVFEAPVGRFADNAAMAFSPDNRSLFSCSGDRALTWDLDTGTISRTWDVAPALVNESVYTPDGKQLFLSRRELVDRSRYPLSDAPPEQFPWIFRAYDLLSDGGGKTPVLELKGFAERTYRAQVASNGLLFLAGFDEDSKSSVRECWDLLTKEKLWSRSYDVPAPVVSFLKLSHRGMRLLRSGDVDNETIEMVDPRSGVAINATLFICCCDDKGRFGGTMSKMIPGSADDNRYVRFFHVGDGNPRASFFYEAAEGFDPEFFEYQNRTHLGWANTKGHIVLIDLETIRSRLETVGLGWKLPESDQ